MKKTILVKFGKKVREVRVKRGLSQEALADIANVHRTYIGMVERAEKNITLLNIQKLSKALKIDIKELFDGI
jgi:transcriptional regulator with XRE-family HTH domain